MERTERRQEREGECSSLIISKILKTSWSLRDFARKMVIFLEVYWIVKYIGKIQTQFQDELHVHMEIWKIMYNLLIFHCKSVLCKISYIIYLFTEKLQYLSKRRCLSSNAPSIICDPCVRGSNCVKIILSRKSERAILCIYTSMGTGKLDSTNMAAHNLIQSASIRHKGVIMFCFHMTQLLKWYWWKITWVNILEGKNYGNDQDSLSVSAWF